MKAEVASVCVVGSLCLTLLSLCPAHHLLWTERKSEVSRNSGRKKSQDRLWLQPKAHVQTSFHQRDLESPEWTVNPSRASPAPQSGVSCLTRTTALSGCHCFHAGDCSWLRAKWCPRGT
ncbi:hypothetical protein CapIbe_011251 [Capra ibex]